MIATSEPPPRRKPPNHRRAAARIALRNLAALIAAMFTPQVLG